jgi:hypothetical protein
MPRLRSFAYLVAAVLTAAAARLTAEDVPAAPPNVDRISQLIAGLGSDEYTAREAASEELARIGLPALAALDAAAVHPDREVRYRSQRVLGLIRQHDIQRRLEAFLHGKESADEYPLPGWSRFKKTYGDDAHSRGLFVEIQRADPELMKSVETGARTGTDMLGQRVFQHQQSLQLGNQQLSLGQISASLFVAAEEDVSLPTQTLTMLLSHCYQPAFRDALTASARRDIPRKMLATIILRSEDMAAFQAMNIAYQFNMPEGIVPAEKILSKQGANNRTPQTAPMAQYALMTVARLGDAAQLPLVEKLLSDTSQLSRMQENTAVYDVQMRDAALAAAVILSKQDLKAYFDIPADQPLSDLQVVFFNARFIGFTSEKKREAVFKKWEDYKARQAKDAPRAATIR